jgi:hypothetical protein
MSYVIAAPEMMTSAAADLATIGSNVNAAHMVAAAPTVAVVPAAADEVSAGIADLFSQHAASYQALAAQAAAFNGQFVQHLSAGAFGYASSEAANAALLQPLTASANSFVGGFDVLVSVVAALPTLLASLPPWQALVFLLALPVSLPLLLFIRYLFIQTLRTELSIFPFG